ncbi:MAG: crossover junction endodeoxyribonuclease RuvC [Segniliparus sp.]|uniref:crossover junction endodeoxyribonuclease RuvC n=1 Tax=Segniliparus sp. TaxID=2804064 RepID=UPI003F3BF305
MRVMGVDPGLTRCGLALVETGAGRAVTALDVDVCRTSPQDPLQDRLSQIADEVEHWLDSHRPDVVAVEQVFAQHNVRTVMGVAQVSGVVALLAAKRSIPMRMHTPSEVKAAVTGNGRADKDQVTAMVTRILGLKAKPTPADAADALALAICHCWRAPLLGRLPGVEGAGGAGEARPNRLAEAVALAKTRKTGGWL